MRKHEAVDLLKLYTLGSHNGWNDFLKKCFAKGNINALAKLRYQLQCGMDDLAKQKLNTHEINVWYLRLIRSLEITAKKIIKIKHPMPGDDPLNKSFPDTLEIKRKRDQELARFFHLSSY